MPTSLTGKSSLPGHVVRDEPSITRKNASVLTRGQVARRLGRSIATVRRMEGESLNPWVDWRGIHRFCEAEVEAVELELRRTGRCLPPKNWLAHPPVKAACDTEPAKPGPSRLQDCVELARDYVFAALELATDAIAAPYSRRAALAERLETLISCAARDIE